MPNISMAIPAMKRREEAVSSEVFSQAQLSPDSLSPKISRVQDEQILTSKDPQFASLLLGIKGICNNFIDKEAVR